MCPLVLPRNTSHTVPASCASSAPAVLFCGSIIALKHYSAFLRIIAHYFALLSSLAHPAALERKQAPCRVPRPFRSRRARQHPTDYPGTTRCEYPCSTPVVLVQVLIMPEHSTRRFTRIMLWHPSTEPHAARRPQGGLDEVVTADPC